MTHEHVAANLAMASVKWNRVFIGRNEAVPLETSTVYKQYPELSIERSSIRHNWLAYRTDASTTHTIMKSIRLLIHLSFIPMFLQYACLAFAFQTVPKPQTTEFPLSYIRNIAIAPVRIDVLDPYTQKLPIPKSIKGGYEYWKSQMLAIHQQRELMQEAASSFPEFLRRRLQTKEHIRLAISDRLEPLWRSIPSSHIRSPLGNEVAGKNGSSEIHWEGLEQLAENTHSQGAVAFSIDYFHNPTQINDTFWIRLKGFFYRSDNKRKYGPFYIYGNIQSGLLYLYTESVQQERIMMNAALEECANRVAETLTSGMENPFTIKKRIAVIPAIVPNALTILDGSKIIHAPLTEVNREADVLFQPSLGPVVTILHLRYDFRSYANLLTSLRNAWSPAGDINVAPYAKAGRQMKASYVFISRVNGITIKLLERKQASDSTDALPDREVAVSAEGALIDPETSQIMWRKNTDAVVVIHKRNKDELTNNQCALEAVIVAYSQLSADYNTYHRRWLIPIPVQ